MTSSSTIEAAWETGVWSNSAITSVTSKIYKFPVTSVSEFELERVRTGGIINVIEATTARTTRTRETATTTGRTSQYEFQVTIHYTKEISPDGTTYQAVRDFYETLHTQVVSGLSDSWSNTVDLWRPQTNPPSISELTLDSVKCWRGTYQYVGTKLQAS